MASIEEKVEDYFKEQLKTNGIKYYIKTAPINTEIDDALKEANSKSGGKGRNYPDIRLLIETVNNRRIPVMIEAKGGKGKLIKYDSKEQIELSTNSVTGYAVNGAIHYARAILDNTDYEEVIAVGVNGTENQDKSLNPEFEAYYVSKKNKYLPKKIEGAEDFTFFKETNHNMLINELDGLNLTDDELEALKQRAESTLEEKIHKIHQSIYDDEVLKTALSTDQKLFLFCGLIMATLSINGTCDLTVDDLKGNNLDDNNDGVVIFNRIKSYLKQGAISQNKRTIIQNLLQNIFINSNLYKPVNGESVFKRLFRQVKEDIIPCFSQQLHLDFAGKIFNKLSDWVSIANDSQNDVVLTPRYVTQLMVKLANTDKDSYVLDSAMGSAGFLVSAMEVMIRDAQDKIKDQEELNKKIADIKQKQICGVEILSSVFMLAIMNMILMGDGSSMMENEDSLSEKMKGTLDNFPTTVFLLNPPYSAKGKGLVFVENALARMEKGRACVLIQENAGSGQGEGYAARILKNNTLLASIHMPTDLFGGKSSVQAAIYLFEANKPHDEKGLVKFIDFSNDGYSRMNRKKSSQEVNLRNTDDAKGRYAELEAIILNKKKDTEYFTKENGLFIEDTIGLNGNDWVYGQHVKIDKIPTREDFKKTVADYLSWKVTQMMQGRAYLFEGDDEVK